MEWYKLILTSELDKSIYIANGMEIYHYLDKIFSETELEFYKELNMLILFEFEELLLGNKNRMYFTYFSKCDILEEVEIQILDQEL